MRALKITNNITRRDEKSLEKYFTEISKHEVLSPEEEYKLFERLNNGEDVVSEIVSHNLRFVVSVAKQYQNLGLSLGDLINEGNVGLIKAAHRFDSSRGFKFISYAVWWIRQSILQAINEKGRKIRVPSNFQSTTNEIIKARIKFLQIHEREPSQQELSDATGISLQKVKTSLQFYKKCSSLDAPLTSDSDADTYEVMKDDKMAPPDEELAFNESIKIKVNEMLQTLPERQALVLKELYGIGTKRSKSVTDIAEEIGVSRERIRQIQKRGVRGLRKKFGDSAQFLAMN